MSNIYAENAARQYGVPAEVMNAVAWAEDAYDATSINASAANIRAEYQKHGNWNDALYAHSMGATADAERATQFTQTVLEVAGYAQGSVQENESGWWESFKRGFGKGYETPSIISGNEGVISGRRKLETIQDGSFIAPVQNILSNGGIIILGIVAVGIAILSVPAIKGAAKTVATRGAA